MKYLWIEDMYYNKIQEWDLLRCILENEREIFLIAINSDNLLKFIRSNNIWDFKVVWNIYKNIVPYKTNIVIL